MESFLVIGDIHLKAKFISDIEVSLNSVIGIIKEAMPLKFLVLLGDIFDNHERVNVFELMAWHKFLEKLMEFNVRIFVLIGNHDRPKNTCFLTDEHPLNSYKNYKNVVIVDKVYQESIELNGVALNFLFVPYVPPGRFLEAIQEFQDMNCIFSHQEFKGTSLGKMISKRGDDPLDIPVINGHIHNYEKLGNLTCIGAIRQVAFNETVDKTVSLFKYTGKEFIETRIPVNSVKKIEIRLKRDEVSTFNFNLLKENRYKITIEAEKSEMDYIVKLVKDRPWISLSFFTIKTREPVTLGMRKTYLENLSTLLSEHAAEGLLFKQLFGEIQMK